MSSSSSSVVRSLNRLPSHCKCGIRLARRVSWTERNPTRRFLVFPKPSFDCTKCDSFYWIDGELNTGWYKQRMYSMYTVMNNEEREVYDDDLGRQELEIEFGDYKAGMEVAIALEHAKMCKWRKISTFLLVVLSICFTALLVLI